MTKFKIPNKPDQHRPGHPLKYRSPKASDRCAFIVRCMYCGARCANQETKIIHQLFCDGQRPEDLPPPRHSGQLNGGTGIRTFHHQKPQEV